MVFIVAYGLAAHIILYPNSELEWSLIKDVLRKPYWQMYGELFLEEIEGAEYNPASLPHFTERPSVPDHADHCRSAGLLLSGRDQARDALVLSLVGSTYAVPTL